MVLVAVRQQQRPHLRAVFLQKRQIRRDDIDSQKLRFGEHHAAIDHDDIVAVPKGHDVHPELSQSAERDDLQLFI